MFSIITLTGPSGSGKSEILKMASNLDSSYVILPKYTTRARRNDDDSSIINVDSLPDNCDYRYTQYGKEYGFSSDAIYECCAKGKKPIVIINDEDTLRKLHNRFGNNVKSYFVHRGKPSLNKLIAICNSRGVTDPDSINTRFEVANNIYRMYTENIRLFDSIILNVGTIDETQKIVEQILNSEEDNANRHFIPQGNKLFIVSGNASSGKDLIVRAASKIGCITVPKHTSRARNPNDGDEMICQGDSGFNLDKCDLKYTNFGGTIYGIEKDRILRNLIYGNANQILCCSNIEAIRDLKETFGPAVVPIYIHSDITPEEYMLAESKEGSNTRYIMDRIEGFRNAHIDYINNFSLYDRCLIYANDERELLRQFAGVLGINIKSRAKANEYKEVK